MKIAFILQNYYFQDPEEERGLTASDEAVLTALAKKDLGESEINCLILTGEEAYGTKALRQALALGGDRARLLMAPDLDFEDIKGLAGLLAKELEDLGPDLVLLGSSQYNYTASILGSLLARSLGWDFQGPCKDLDIRDEGLDLVLEGGKEDLLIQAPLPLVLVIKPGPQKPIFPSVMAISRAFSQEIDTKDLGPASEGPKINIRRVPEKTRDSQVFTGLKPEEGAEKILAILKKEGFERP